MTATQTNTPGRPGAPGAQPAVAQNTGSSQAELDVVSPPPPEAAAIAPAPPAPTTQRRGTGPAAKCAPADRVTQHQPGDCDLCGGWSSHLTQAACPACRKKWNLP